MAKKTQAQIEFKAVTSEFNQGIKNMNSDIKSLNNALKLNATELKGNAASVDKLKERQQMLNDKYEASSKKVELTEKSLQACKDTLGENSTEYKNLSNALNRAKTEQQGIQNELEQTTNKLQAMEKAEKDAKTPVAQLNSKIDSQEKELADLKEEYKNVYLEQGKSSTEAKELEGKIKSLSGELDKNKKKLENAETALEKMGTAAKTAGKKAGELGERLTGAGKKLSVVSAGIVGAGTASVAAFKEVDKGADNAIKKTGATGKAAESLEKSYKNLAGSIVGDFSDIGNGLGEVETRFNITGKQAETTTRDFLKFASVNDIDVTDAVQKVSRYMGDAGIDASEYSGVLDNLTVAAQASGISMDTLTENLTKYGAPMRALGFDTKESIAVFSSWEKAGVNTEIAFSGMKKAISNWSKEGKDSRVEFKKTLKEIGDCPDIASATTKAIEVFGAKAGPDLADAIQCGRFEYEDFLAILDNSDGALKNTYKKTQDGTDKMTLAMQNAKIAAGDVGKTLGETLAPIVEKVSGKLQGFSKWWQGLSDKTQKTIFVIAGIVAAIGPVLIVIGTICSSISKIITLIDLMKKSTLLATIATKAQAVAQGVLNAVMSANPITLIIVAIVALIAVFVVLWKKCDKFREFWQNLWEKIKDVAQKIGEKISALKDKVVEKFTEAKNKAVAILNNIKSKVTSIINSLKSGIIQKITSIKSKVTTVFNSVKESMMKPIYFAKDKIKSAIDKIKSFFNVSLKFKSIKMPHFSVTYDTSGAKGKIGKALGLDGFPKLSVKWYAKGGYFPKPTIIADKGIGVGDSKGGEYALPLNNSTLSPLAAMINKNMAAQGYNKGTDELLKGIYKETRESNRLFKERMIDALVNGVDLVIDNRELARLIKKYG